MINPPRMAVKRRDFFLQMAMRIGEDSKVTHVESAPRKTKKYSMKERDRQKYALLKTDHTVHLTGGTSVCVMLKRKFPKRNHCRIGDKG